MKKCSVKALAKIISAAALNNAAADVTGVSTDTRTIQPGDCFFALHGDTFNGHDYLAAAFTKGAACAVVSGNFPQDESNRPLLLKVDDTLKALSDFARHYRKSIDAKVVAITGSVGKTTTRQIIYHVLSSRFRCHQSPKNFNNHIGLPLTLLTADEQHEIIVAEIGADGPGQISHLAQIAQPDIAVVTNVHPAHLSGFGTVENIAREKLSIRRGLQTDENLIINADSQPLIKAGREKSAQFKTFSISGDADYRAQNITNDAFATTFAIDATQITLPLPGPGGVENALAAWAVADRLGLSIDDFANALKSLPQIPMRAELLQIGTITVLNDCYNANPASMKNALDILANIAAAENRRPVFICGHMAELGDQTKQLHIELGRHIAQAKVKCLIAVGELAATAAHAAKQAAAHDLKIECFDDTDSACNCLQKIIKDNDVILVKGSRVAALERTVEKLKEIFSQSHEQTADSELLNTR